MNPHLLRKDGWIMPSLIDIVIVFILVWGFFCLSLCLGFGLINSERLEEHSMTTAGVFSLPIIDDYQDENYDEPYYDEDAYMESRDLSEFFPDSSEDEDMRERDWL